MEFQRLPDMDPTDPDKCDLQKWETLAEDGSLLIFEFKNFDGEEDAKELCQRFAAKGSCETAFCIVALKSVLALESAIILFVDSPPILFFALASQHISCDVS